MPGFKREGVARICVDCVRTIHQVDRAEVGAFINIDANGVQKVAFLTKTIGFSESYGRPIYRLVLL